MAQIEGRRDGWMMIWVRFIEDCYDLVPWRTIQVLQDVMEEGHDKGFTGWRDKGILYHLDRIQRHIDLYMDGDTSEDHLGHIFTRAIMAKAIERGN